MPVADDGMRDLVLTTELAQVLSPLTKCRTICSFSSGLNCRWVMMVAPSLLTVYLSREEFEI